MIILPTIIHLPKQGASGSALLETQIMLADCTEMEGRLTLTMDESRDLADLVARVVERLRRNFRPGAP